MNKDSGDLATEELILVSRTSPLDEELQEDWVDEGPMNA